MKNIMDKLRIITLKEQGFSNRKVAAMVKSDRKTVSKYWNEYLANKEKLTISQYCNPETAAAAKIDVKEIQEQLMSAPKYNAQNRKRTKFTQEVEERLLEILEEEVQKDKILGTHKQQRTKKQMYEILAEEGFDISLSTINLEINRIRKHTRECFIRQEYAYGDRLEYDFGEVKLEIAGKVDTYHMAVLSSPGGDFRWAYLYTSQKKEVFMDSHVQFFEMVKGVYREVVYDNMKNVVTRFIGRNERELNEDLVKMSLYYGFSINVTNCFSGNEKGYVESSVKILRNKIFADNYRFNTLDDARAYLSSRLLKLNENSSIEEEKQHLLPYMPKLELATMSENEVNTYSFIQVENNFYSVPEYLVGHTVTVKNYYDEICVYANNEKVCNHKKLDGQRQISVDISHYLNTLYKKPGAIRNSLALKSIPKLKAIFDKYYSNNPRRFIEMYMRHKDHSIDEIIGIFEESVGHPLNVTAIDVVCAQTNMDIAAMHQLMQYSSLCKGGVSI